MKPGIEAAWIAASGGFLGVLVGVTGTAIVARLGFRNTRDATNVTTAATMATVEAQIEADRQSRIWEKRADIYTDFLATIKRRQESRRNAMQGMINGSEPQRLPAPLDVALLEARLLAYASAEVIAAANRAGNAAQDFEHVITEWRETIEVVTKARPSTVAIEARQAASIALQEADQRDEAVTELIRAELHAERSSRLGGQCRAGLHSRMPPAGAT
jgi:hypothetical protein